MLKKVIQLSDIRYSHCFLKFNEHKFSGHNPYSKPAGINQYFGIGFCLAIQVARIPRKVRQGDNCITGQPSSVEYKYYPVYLYNFDSV